MKLVECWRWRFRDPASGTRPPDDVRDQRRGGAKFPQAERMPGTLIIREVDEIDFADTLPSVGVSSTK